MVFAKMPMNRRSTNDEARDPLAKKGPMTDKGQTMDQPARPKMTPLVDRSDRDLRADANGREATERLRDEQRRA